MGTTQVEALIDIKMHLSNKVLILVAVLGLAIATAVTNANPMPNTGGRSNNNQQQQNNNNQQQQRNNNNQQQQNNKPTATESTGSSIVKGISGIIKTVGPMIPTIAASLGR